MKQQHHNIDLRTYEKGITSDNNKEILGGSKNGEHVDSLNMRSISMDGDNFAKKKIKGEGLLYDAVDNRCFLPSVGTLSPTYRCMLSLEINEHIVEVWASTNNTFPPFIRVNGKIVLMSFDFPVDTDYPLQYDKNESCIGGEFYITNNVTTPMVFSLKDLMMNAGMTDEYPDAQCTQKYFDDFNIQEYVVDVISQLYKPMFINQDVSTTAYNYNAVLGSLGLPVGSYSYSYRYATQAGDRGKWSPVTELIPVTSNVGVLDDFFPGRRTYSSNPDVSTPSGYGNHIRIRVENYNNFDFIELRRDCWYVGDPIGTPSISELVGFVDITSGVYAIDVLDRCSATEVEEILTLEESANTMTALERAKSIRYFNERLYLMNVAYASKDIDNDVEFVDDQDLIFPVVQKIGKLGHKSPYNATHYKSNMRSEKYGFGVILFDKEGNTSYVKKIDGAENFLMPNRRTPISTLSAGMSYNGSVRAALENPIGILQNVKVSDTYEVFDHEDAVSRTGDLSANVFENNIDPEPYEPFRPVSQGDNSSSYGSRVNVEIKNGGATGDWEDYNPRAFGLNYYSMGVSFKGVDVSSLPDWAAAFSVVQTAPASRVLAQGFGWYSMVEAETGAFGGHAGKEVDELWVYFPDGDVETGIRPQLHDDILANYQNGSYKIQAVSPLGYFTEVYSFNNNTFKDIQADVITYARVLHDEGQINPTTELGYYSGAPMGILSASRQYVGYAAFKFNMQAFCNPTTGCPYVNNGSGDHLFNITSVQSYTSPTTRMSYLIIKLDQPIYVVDDTDSFLDEKDLRVRQWQEPMYVVNLIREEAQIIESNITAYNYTGHHQRIKSTIGEGTGLSATFKLVSERWEDCIQTVSGQTNNAYSGADRFVWVEDSLGVPKRWLNVTNKSNATINTIKQQLNLNGVYFTSDIFATYPIYGIYTSSEEYVNQHVGFNIIFQLYGSLQTQYCIPQVGKKVYVYYDNRIPVRVFGGDTYINESIWAPLDFENNASGDPLNSLHEFKWDVPMPYNKYKLSNDIRIIKDSGGVGGHIQDFDTFNFRITQPARIRQWVCMWTAETRTNLSFAFNTEDPKESQDQFFPLKNYVMRANKWSVSNDGSPAGFYADNKIYTDYYDDYGSEYLFWGLGGFRFRPQNNIDYCKTQTNLLLTSVPLFGFEEQTEYCTRIIWSERRPINVQNTPTVRTFPSQNYYDISDDTGCIKFAWSAISGDKGNNLYAITDGGVCLLLVDKRIIHEINANELATIGSDVGGILNELWIDRNIGMTDETWRTWAEYSNMLMFGNYTSMYAFSDNQLVNLGDTGFNELYRREFLPALSRGYISTVSGGYNVLTKEYIINASRAKFPNSNFSTLIYGIQQQALQCQSTYNYDKYLYIGNKTYGMKDGKTFQLGIGNQIDGENMEAYVTGLSDAQIYSDKEFIRIRVNSNSKPDKIYFYDSYQDYINNNFSSVVDATSNAIAIKDYYGYECYIPRRIVAPHYRQQGRVVLFKIVSTEDEDFLVTSTGVQYKQLK